MFKFLSQGLARDDPRGRDSAQSNRQLTTAFQTNISTTLSYQSAIVIGITGMTGKLASCFSDTERGREIEDA
ncbi:uncharacterized protein N7483_012649 [Penicillium malachiteum]|uniref:uncharacterized protein n=1 Tax=Penicillium malachiteum TaxID=1324776 RepID=UPI002547655C|nr:uncharacterized protein N7483_012649 [Penicillium malachiteum]KAJ5715468.1 hypothetical protein N7483_012649 [Penicillium malachiteum]